MSLAAQALLCELSATGPSGEFLRQYFEALSTLTVDDLRVLNHAPEWRQRLPEPGLSQALFWGWRRHLEAQLAQRTKT